ncbi:MAG: PhzF family phenazine biosynthesis protein [Pseudomonadota bacterium]
MRLPLYQVDAFTSSVFHGNPAGVVPLEEWLTDDLMQAVAAENNLAETAFFRPGDDEGFFELRWFTPTVEVPLCGHATLASAFIIMNDLNPDLDMVSFDTRSGRLHVTRDRDLFILDLPTHELRPREAPGDIVAAIGAEPTEAFAGQNYLFVFETEADVAALSPDMAALKAALEPADCGLICTAPREGEGDFVSRYFAPVHGIPEDPVTGSAHCMLTPYWAQRLNAASVHGFQISDRVGELFCTLKGERVEVAGRAAKYMDAIAYIPDRL